MKFLRALKIFPTFSGVPILFLLSIGLWLYALRGYGLGQLAIYGDAHNYYEHTEFFLENITRGVFPLWESSRQTGVPTEFFMRRIGEFNPFYSIILLFQFLGLSFTKAYLSFLYVYYLLGMAGFYILAKRVFQNSILAFLSFLLLLFSTQATLLFSSFIHLTFVPMIWFGTFFLAFYQEPKKLYLLGMTFCLMIIVTTYVPFYFLTILLIYIILTIIVYAGVVKTFFSRFIHFSKNNKIFVGLCLLMLMLSLIPGLSFYRESAKGEIVIPTRHYNSPVDNVLGVAKQRTEFGGVIPHLLIEEIFGDFHHIRGARVFVPFFWQVLILLAFAVSINKRLSVLYIWGFSLMILALYDAGVYQFLFDHVFYFKFFRNFQFFFWTATLPIFVLLCTEQLRLYWNMDKQTPKYKRRHGIFIFLLHMGLVIYLIFKDGALVTSYLVVVLSYLFFTLYLMDKINNKKTITFFLLTLIVTIQPMEVFHYLHQNANKTRPGFRYGRYLTDRPYRFMSLPKDEKTRDDKLQREKAMIKESSGILKKNIPSMYMATKWDAYLLDNLRKDIYYYYTDFKLILYDQTLWFDEDKDDLQRVGRAFLKNENLAFVADQAAEDRISPGRRAIASHAEIITQDSKIVQVIEKDANILKLRTKFDTKKFLVYNDGYNSGWNVYVNGHRHDLIRANVAFKGLWVPAGENVVTFRFGSKGLYLFKFFMIGLFWFALIYMGWLVSKEIRVKQREILRGREMSYEPAV